MKITKLISLHRETVEPTYSRQLQGCAVSGLITIVMLKETPASLRAYFGLIALFAILPMVAQLSEGKPDVGGVVTGLLFGGLYAFVAVRMDYLLSQRPGFIRGVLILNLVLSGLAAAVGIVSGRGISGLPVLVVAFAITAYLLSSAGRLSREVSHPPVPAKL